MKFNSVFSLVVLLSVMVLFACKKEESEDLKGRINIEITDAPIDDANIKSAFVTIAEVKLNGKAIEGFNRKTVDLLTLRNGNTSMLFDGEVQAKSYNEFTLVLDTENQPGCYIEETNGNKHELVLTSQEINLSNNYMVESEGTAQLVVDFDLRKAIRRDQDNKYNFVSQTEMQSAVRVVSKNRSGKINGICEDLITNSDKVIVYAYKKGTFNRSTEIEGQGQSDIEFSNAVTSSIVAGDGQYQLHFLEEGEYELHFASYKENTNGQLELRGTLILDVLSGLDLGSLAVGASGTLTVNVVVTGILLV